MGIAADDIHAKILADWNASAAALAWQLDMGLSDVIGEDPVSAYDLSEANPQRAAPTAPVAPTIQPAPTADPVQSAKDAAAAAGSLTALHQALKDFEGCELKRGARNTVFADGNPTARVLILGEAPGREEDIEGRPFIGAAGQLLDKMFAAIGLSRGDVARESAIYITNVLPWRPSGDRDPLPEEVVLLMPFVRRHIELIAPQVIVTLGNTPLFALTGSKGILRTRGTWGQALGRPHLPMLHPAYLMSNPAAKREAWADLLSLKDWLRNN